MKPSHIKLIIDTVIAPTHKVFDTLVCIHQNHPMKHPARRISTIQGVMLDLKK